MGFFFSFQMIALFFPNNKTLNEFFKKYFDKEESETQNNGYISIKMLGNDPNFINNILYKIIIAIIIIISQFYIIIMAAMNYNNHQTMGKVGIVLGIILRIVFILKSIDVNFYDSLINIKRTMGKTKYQMGSIFVIVLYFIAFILCIAIYFLSYIYDLPYIDTISYDNRSIIEFIKHNNTIIGDVAKPFCNFHSDETEFKTEDFALLSTLPRLYDVNTEGKCFIKPKFRGVFNSTMKYIFGEDYNSQGIRIYCWAKTYNPYLIITSQSLLESKKSVFEKSTITDI